MDHHAPIRKSTVCTRPSPWIDDELGEAFSQRNMAKILAAKSKFEIDEQNYRTLRNYAVKLNRRKKRYFTTMLLLIIKMIVKRYGTQLRAYLVHLSHHAHLVWSLTGE